MDLSRDTYVPVPSNAQPSASKAKKAPPGLKLSGKDLGASWALSESMGTFSKDGWKLNRQGMKREESGPYGMEMSPDDLHDLGDLGRGAGGIVKKMLHVPSLELIALKSIDVFEKGTRHQLLMELNALANSDCPNVVCFYGGWFEKGSTKLALEYMNRGSLQNVIDKYGCLSEDVIASIATQCLTGLGHLHSNRKLHRDIKPANILVDGFGNVKIADFGIVRPLTDAKELAKTFVGTASYMSPERIQSDDYSYPADVWSLGLSLVTCAMGKQQLHTGDGYWGLHHQIVNEPIRLPETFSKGLQSFVNSCLHKNPNHRARIKDLQRHPFILNHGSNCPVWPFEPRGSMKERTELREILTVLIQRNFQDGSRDYKKSLFDICRFRRLGQQLGFDETDVVGEFEALLAQKDAELRLR